MNISEDFSMENFLANDKVIAVINLLTKFKIRLWELKNLALPESQSEFEELIMKISDESGLIENELKSILIRLQEHSVKKFADNKRFNEQQIAVFKLKIIGNLNKNQNEKILSDNFEASINLTGLEFNNLIKATFDLDCDSLKVICNGKVLREDSLLVSQDIKNHSTMLAMCVYDRISREMTNDANTYKLISDIKDAVNLLTDQKLKGYDTGLEEFNLQNQNGRSIDISQQDTRFLTSAMILHEKGKKLMKSKNYIMAIILLAEADNQFKNCTDHSLLGKIDNYALLNLDIIWCYLAMENLHELKNAEERLNTCESCLKKCYGSDLERLSKIKSDTANTHNTIFAILQYHKGKKRECREYLIIAQRELKKITIDEDKLLQVMSMGFSSTESRLALRASFNNVDEAIEQIIRKNKLKAEAKKIEKEANRAKSLERKYGRTLNQNKQIDMNLLDDLIQLGYKEKPAAVALVRADNNFQLALDLISLIEPDFEKPTGLNANLQESLNHLVALGYDSEICKKILEKFGNSLEKAANFLIENKHEFNDVTSESAKEKMDQLLGNLASRQSDPGASTSREMEEKTLEAQKLLKKISAEMPADDEEYLDLNIDEDAFYINKYYSLLDN